MIGRLIDGWMDGRNPLLGLTLLRNQTETLATKANGLIDGWMDGLFYRFYLSIPSNQISKIDATMSSQNKNPLRQRIQMELYFRLSPPPYP